MTGVMASAGDAEHCRTTALFRDFADLSPPRETSAMSKSLIRNLATRNPATRNFAAGIALIIASPALAQRADENAVASASDGFGATVGNERVGVYSTTSVRGFNPITAGNRRLDGLYFDLGGNGLTNRLYSRATVRIGLPALAYPYPAPSGIVDYQLRKAGTGPLLSVVAGLPAYGGYSLEVDGQAPSADGRFAMGAGLSLAENTYVDGRDTRARSAALLPTLRFERNEWTAFLGYSQTAGDVPPILITAGPQLPPSFDSSRFHGQRWIDNDQRSWTYGLLGRIEIADGLTLRLGAFESRSVRRHTFADLYLDVQPDGTAQNVVVSDPRLPARWTSGEARLSWDFDVGEVEQTLHAALRGRDKRLESGGSAQAALGSARLGMLTPAAEPAFVYSDPTTNQVRQATAGLAYIGRWKDLELNLGLQKTNYRSRHARAGQTDQTEAKPWLYNATLAYAPSEWLGFYAGTTRGLEESAAAPASAANRDEAVPASRTQQYDAGARVALGAMRLVGGVFQLERPYYSVGAGNLYGPLGEVQNRGVELSIAGPLTERLSVVAGMVLSDPRVVGEAFAAGRVGRRPVGSSNRSARIDMEYRAPFVDRLALTLGLQHSGAIAASTGNYLGLGDRQLEVPSATTVDLGARYSYELGGIPMSARLQVLNVFDTRRPLVASSNAFLLPDTRRLTLQIAADF
jgi:iron complex outermembrane receptor protein